MSLQSIQRFSNDNIGGLLELRLASAADIESIPSPLDGVVFGDIVFKPGKGWSIWAVTHGSLNTKSNSLQTREGNSKENVLPFLIAKDRASIRNILLLAEDDEVIVLYKDANGTQKIFGLLDRPAKFKFDHDSGVQIGDLNHYACELYFSGPDNMYEYDGTISSPPVGTLPAIVQYNGSPIASLAPGQVLNIISEFGFTDFYVTS